MQTDSFCKRNILVPVSETMQGMEVFINPGYPQNEIRSRSGSTFEIKDNFCKDKNEENSLYPSTNIYGISS